MKIVVFGSTGKSGQQVIQQGLARGYEVVAYARTPEKIEIKHEALTIIKGELHDTAAIERAIIGADAVISFIGPGTKIYGTSLSDGVKNITAAMQKHGVKRILQTATNIAKDPQDKPHFKLDFMMGLIKFIQPKVHSEITSIADTIRVPQLDWTLVRLPFLNDEPLSKQVHARYKGGMKDRTKLSRADLAWFMLEQLESLAYIQKSPFVTN